MRFVKSNIRYGTALPLVLLGLLSALPAGAATRGGTMMTLGAATPPPLGFVEMCARMPAACGSDPTTTLSAPAAITASPRTSVYDRYFWSVALSGDAPAAGYIARRERAIKSPAVFRGFARTTEYQPQATGQAAEAGPVASVAVTLSHASWTQLNTVNRQVNRAIRERSDISSVGVADRWSLPILDGRRVGDCEDFALEKRRMLIEAGISPSALSIALVRTRWGESHAVLLVTTDRGEYVLDSLTPWISHWASLDYRWVQRQVPGAPLRWVSIAPA